MSRGDSTTSSAWLARAASVMPGRQSNLRGAQDLPFVFERGSGIRLRDVDGREYLDFTLGMGPAIWGYSNERYFAAIEQQLRTLFSIASARGHSTAEIELAERIRACVPCAEWVRFGISGTEAVQLAIRIARAWSGRPRFVRFEGHYHGWMDNVAGPGGGRWSEAGRESFVLPWNDLGALEQLLAHQRDQIGLVLMEAVMCNHGCCPPRPGYLEGVRELCTRHGVALCFDEVITGFRVALGGAQEHFGVTPDLAVFGKALAGGLPLSAIAGRAELLAVLRDLRVEAGGTFNAFPLAMAAGLTTLQMLAENEGAHFRRIDALQSRIIAGLRDVFVRHALPALVQGPRGIFAVAFTNASAAYSAADLVGADTERLRRFSERLREHGVIMAGGGRFNLSSAMRDPEVEEFLQAADRAAADLAAGT